MNSKSLSLFHFKVSATRWSVTNLEPENPAGSLNLGLNWCGHLRWLLWYSTVDWRLLTSVLPASSPRVSRALLQLSLSIPETRRSHHVEQLNRRIEVGEPQKTTFEPDGRLISAVKLLNSSGCVRWASMLTGGEPEWLTKEVKTGVSGARSSTPLRLVCCALLHF